jgi:hypothetical protein
MKNKTFAIVLAILVMAATAAWGSSATPSTLTADGASGHMKHGCMLCHTPHAAGQLLYSPAATTGALPGGAFSTSSAPAAGAWKPAGAGTNRGVSVYLWLNPLTPITYTTWDGGTLSNNGNETAQNPEVHSLLCMSCHDGSVTGGSYDMGGTLAGAGTTAPSGTTTGAYNTPNYKGVAVTQYNGGSSNNGWGAGDLQSTHPVHTVYPTTYNTTTSAYSGPNSYWAVSISGGPGGTVTFKDTTFDLGIAAATGGEATGHPAKLYTDGSNAYVECTSCHEPHRETNYAYNNGGTWKIGGPSSTAYYIRGPFNAPAAVLGSDLGNNNTTLNGTTAANFCRSCHYDKSQAYITNSGSQQ